MFKIESYITPLLMGYVDKYVKLRTEDFQLSLWGGDAVLNNLDLRLDVLEKAIQLPITFKSGHIHELRIHVPWTKLTSEPLVITINTIECIFKLRDTPYSNTTSKNKNKGRPKVKAKGEEELPPGYLQSLISKVMNNVSIIVNNLIVKFVEDDIVLSVNLKSAEIYSVDQLWNRAFTELSAPDFVLRKAVNICDLTACLDKCDSSGKIETYQDPLVYRCSINGRLYLKHDSIHAKIPSLTKFDIFCDKLDISITDTQLPMFIRLIELCITLYYGAYEVPSSAESIPEDLSISRNDTSITMSDDGLIDEQEMAFANNQGWVSWAWSYVPQILPPGEEDEENVDGAIVPKKKEPLTLSIGLYAHKGSIVFKLTEVLKEKLRYGANKVAFRPFLSLEGEGVGLDILAKGLGFFDIQFGISYAKLLTKGTCICCAAEDEDPRICTVLEAGEELKYKTILNYYSQSLFDIGCPVNQGKNLDFIFGYDEHLNKYTEQTALQRFGFFYLDYVYTMPCESDSTGSEASETSSASDHEESRVFVEENSMLRFIFGLLHVNVSSSAYHRIHKMICCGYEYNYEPYMKNYKDPEIVSKGPPTDAQIQSIEEYISSRTTHLALIKPSANLFYADHPFCHIDKKVYQTGGTKAKVTQGKSEENGENKLENLPSLFVSAERFDLQVNSAMYPKKVAGMVSAIAGPSNNLVHHCYTHTQIKVFSVCAGLHQICPDGNIQDVLTVLSPCSGAVYQKTLLFSKFWRNNHIPKSEVLYQLPQLAISFNKPQLLLGIKYMVSWFDSNPNPKDLHGTSLIVDTFSTEKDKTSMEVNIYGLEMKTSSTRSVQSYNGNISSFQSVIHVAHEDYHAKVPVLCAPANTSTLYDCSSILINQINQDTRDDFLVFTCQFPHNKDLLDAPSLFLLNMEGAIGVLDPALLDWFSYEPTEPEVEIKIPEVKVFVDMALAESASPLNFNKSQASIVSSGSHSHPTKSKTQNKSGHTRKTSQMTKDLENKDSDKHLSWHSLGDKMANIFPIFRMTQVQVDIKNCVLFINKQTLPVTNPILCIPLNYVTALQTGQDLNALVLCLPSVHINSAGARTIVPLQEIPVFQTEESLISDKLPWKMLMTNFSVYTLLKKQKSFYIVKPTSVNSTVAVNSKYYPATSDNVSSLGLCLHMDVNHVVFAFCQEQVQMCSALLGWVISLCSHAHKVVNSVILKPKEEKTTKLHTQNEQVPFSPRYQREISATLSLSEGGMLTETGTSTGLLSRENTPIRDMNLEDKTAAVKLSVWLQWTLPKLEVIFFKTDEVKKGETKVVVLLEDIAASFDFEALYAKIKMTCGDCSVKHMSKKGESDWQYGPYLGTLMTSHRSLSHSVHIVTNDPLVFDSKQHKYIDTRPRDPSKKFMSITFTRALCQNVKDRMKRMNVELPFYSDLDDDPIDLYWHKYISEVCLSLESCDFVVFAPALQTILTCIDLSSPSSEQSKPAPTVEGPIYPQPRIPFFNSTLLPLLYVDICSTRVFLPVKKEAISSKKDDGSQVISTIDQDLVVVIVQNISINPQAENPLPRYPLDADIFSRSIQSGMDQQPGSCVENRQYQMDIKGGVLCTGNWNDFEEDLKAEEKVTPTSGVQNPALEWNTKPHRKTSESLKPEIYLISVVPRVDMKVVLAPAIVYKPEDGSRPILVCGHTGEVNATKDIDLFLSTNQIILLQQLVSQSTTVFLYSSQNQHFDAKDRLPLDSGIGSDISPGNKVDPLANEDKQEESKNRDKPKQKPVIIPEPFDFLLTASRISLALYNHKVLKGDIVVEPTKKSKLENHLKYFIGSDDEDDSDQSDNTRGEDIDTEETEKHVTAGSCVLEPFLYLFSSQPSIVASFNHSNQKFEMLCYDMALKGSHHKYIPMTHHKVLPSHADFTLNWIETRQGETNIKTGILPNLLTVIVKDFLSKAADAKMDVERPLKIMLSADRLDLVLHFLDSIGLKLVADETSKTTKNTKHTSEEKLSTSDIASKVSNVLERLELYTKQVIVAIETGPEFNNCGVTCGTEEIKLECQLNQNIDQILSSADIFLSCKDAQVKTSYHNKARTLLGPFSIGMDISVDFYDYGSDLLSCLFPMVTTNIHTSLVSAWVGQEHYMTLQHLIEQAQEILEKFSAPPTPQKAAKLQIPPKNQPEKTKQTEFITRKFSDDLRSGSFVYAQSHESHEVLPLVGEISFCNYDSNGDSCMTWCYPQPRVLTSVEVMPIPVNVPDDISQMEEDDLMIPCTLFYLDLTTNQFIPFIDFELSESRKTKLDLPEVKILNKRELVLSSTWKVVIRHSIRRRLELDRMHAQGAMPDPDSDLLICPESLAAAMCVNSCFIPSLLPYMQLYLVCPAAELRLINTFEYLGRDIPAAFKPFTFDEQLSRDQEYAVAKVQNLSLIFTHVAGSKSLTSLQMNTIAELDFTEYRNLCKLNLVSPFEIYCDVSYKAEKPPVLETNLTFEPVQLALSKSAVHTLNTAALAWSQVFKSADEPQVIMSHYVICNDSHLKIRFGQTGTDEDIHLKPRQMHAYSWRTHKSNQLLHLTVEEDRVKWSEPFCLDVEGQFVRSVKYQGQIATFIINVVKQSHVQKKILIGGQIKLYSCLTQPLEVKVMKTGSESEITFCLESDYSPPSFVFEPWEIKSMRMRPFGHDCQWSHDVFVTGDRMKENRMIKLQQADGNFYHIWCRILCQHISSAHKTEVLLSPLYVVRSHLARPLIMKIDTPSLKLHQKLVMPGQGKELQLQCFGAEVTHSLTFQISEQQGESSSQAVQLSTGLINQVEHSTVNMADISTATSAWKLSKKKEWPYRFYHNHRENETMGAPAPTSTEAAESCLDVTDTDTADLGVTLNIHLSEYWPACSTLLVDITPSCLVTNSTDLDLIIMHSSGCQWTLLAGKTFCPPYIKGTLCLGYGVGLGVVCSGVITVSEEEEDLVRYNPDGKQTLYLDNAIKAQIVINKGSYSQVYFLGLQSSVHNRMRIITIQHSICITNYTPHNFLALVQCAVPRLGKVPLVSEEIINIDTHNKTHQNNQSDLRPLVAWNLAKDTADDREPVSEDDNFVHYITLSSHPGENTYKPDLWSHPVRLLADKNAVRATLCVPMNGGENSLPVCVTGHEKHGITYYVLRDDAAPCCIIDNKLSVPLYYGHQNKNITVPGVMVQEETELIGGIPSVLPGSQLYYTPSYVNGTYPQNKSSVMVPNMFLAVNKHDISGDTTEKQLVWTSPLNINSKMEMFVPLPNCLDIKVRVRKVAMSTYITVEPVSKVEVSALEIRSRIQGKKSVQEKSGRLLSPEVAKSAIESIETSPDNENKSVHKDNENVDIIGSGDALPMKENIKAPVKKPVMKNEGNLELYCGLRFHQVSVVLQDETSDRKERADVIRITMDELYLMLHPSPGSQKDGQRNCLCLSACVGSLQVDNQLFFSKGLYDFPVLFYPNPENPKTSTSNLSDMNIVEKFAVLKSTCFGYVHIVQEPNCVNVSVIKSLEFGMKPAIINIDDNLVFRLMKEIEGLLPPSGTTSTELSNIHILPLSVRSSSFPLSRPLQIENLFIQEIRILLSVHASVKLFISADRTPLTFKNFEQFNICALSQNFLMSLVIHYTTAALFRAGIVVGSLDIIGNPTGLVRSVSVGVSDLVMMPANGMRRGPRAFVSGLSSGVSSFVKNISAGMVTSMTSFASSVSRNMDKLSLDEEHQLRQEVIRHQQPEGIASGLKQGLTGFGLSLLGAVAGLADKPIQKVIASQELERNQTKFAATGLMSGVGQGIIGAFTKPIGGAAEFVSRTGQGFLKGTGLSGNLPCQKFKSKPLAVSELENSCLKYSVKFVRSFVTCPVQALVTAKSITNGTKAEVDLLLTKEYLIIINQQKDTQQQMLALQELEILSHEDLNRLVVVWKQVASSDKDLSTHSERVADFIDHAVVCGKVEQPSETGSDNEGISLSPLPGVKVTLSPTYEFLLHPTYKEAFTTVFHLCQNKLEGKGFSY